jgi:hypothetical protein
MLIRSEDIMKGIAGRGGFRKGREVDFPAVFLPFQLRTFCRNNNNFATTQGCVTQGCVIKL